MRFNTAWILTKNIHTGEKKNFNFPEDELGKNFYEYPPIKDFFDGHYEEYLLHYEEEDASFVRFKKMLEADIPRLMQRRHDSCVIRCGNEKIRICGANRISKALDIARAEAIRRHVSISQGDWESCDCNEEDIECEDAPPMPSAPPDTKWYHCDEEKPRPWIPAIHSKVTFGEMQVLMQDPVMGFLRIAEFRKSRINGIYDKRLRGEVIE